MRDHLTEGLAWLAKGAEQPDAPERSSSSEIQDSHEANDGDVSASKAHALAAKAVPALAGGDPIVPPADQIARALGPNALQMEGKDGKPGGVVISDVPLAVPDPDAKDGSDWQPADLTFKAQGSRLVATRSLVPTSVPDAADGTFRVGPLGVRLAPEGSDSTATSYETSVIHPNVATDTDLATRSIGSGLKFGWVLRSPDASQTQRAKLDLPAGANATLVDGAVRITDAKGDQVGTVSPAAATDADGISVPIETSLEGDTVSYRLKTDLSELRTPVVIDPEMLYEWSTGDTDIDGWVYNENATPFSGTIIANDGMRIKGEPGTGYASQTWGGYTHWAPGDPSFGTVSSVSGQVASPEHGFFWKAEFGGLNYTLTAPYSVQDPNVNIGVLSSTDVNHPPTQRYQKQNATGGWGAPVASNLRQIPAGTLGATYRVYVGTDSTTPPAGGTNAKPDAVFSAVLYDFGLNGASNIARPKSELRIGWTKLWAADNVNPVIATATPNTVGTTGWLGLTSNISTTASDRGTGIEKVEIYNQANTTLYGPGVAKTCVATGKVLCPFAFNDTVPVAPVPEGIGDYTMRATDGGGRTGTKAMTLKVDKTPPGIDLGGTLFTNRTTRAANNEQRTLTVTATDGDVTGGPQAQRAGVEWVAIFVDGEQVSYTAQPASGDSQSLAASWTPPDNSFATADHQVQVVTSDRLGHQSEAAFFAGSDDVAPQSVTGLDADYDVEGEAGERTQVSWDAPEDPNSSTGDAGSGVVAYKYRYKAGAAGTWTSWTLTGSASFDPAGIGEGVTLDVEVQPFDRASNAGPVTAATVTTGETPITVDDPSLASGGDGTGIEFDPPGTFSEDEPDGDGAATATSGVLPALLPEPAPSEGSGQSVSLDGQAVTRQSTYTETLCRDGNPCGRYNGNAAARYAEKYWNSKKQRNYDYPYYKPNQLIDNNDCTNFASQALKAGGMRFMRAGGQNTPQANASTNSRYRKGEGSWWSKYRYVGIEGGGAEKDFSDTDSWRRAPVLRQHLLEYDLGFGFQSVRKLRRGDLVFANFYSPDASGIHHAMVVSRITKSGPWLAYHSRDRQARMKDVLASIRHVSAQHAGVSTAVKGTHFNWWVVRPQYTAANITG